MDIYRSEGQQDAGAGTFLAALRGGRGRRCSTRLLGAPQLDDIERPDTRAWAEYEADTDADDAVICSPFHALVALLEVREVWKARRSADSVRLELLDPDAARLPQAVCRDAVLALPFGDQTQGDDNLCAISLGKEDEEFADTQRLAVALISPVALRRAVRLKTIVIYLTESELDPLELLVHPFSQTVREAGELGGNTGQNQLRRTAMGLRKKARKTPPASLALWAEQRPIYTLTLQLTAHHHSIIGGTRGTD
eukprot:jgi/Tetstr1/433019/TSEL_022356.t1